MTTTFFFLINQHINISRQGIGLIDLDGNEKKKKYIKQPDYHCLSAKRKKDNKTTTSCRQELMDILF